MPRGTLIPSRGSPPDGWGRCPECERIERWRYLKLVGDGGARCAECRDATEEYEDD